jgi:hypothetical protein
MLAPLSEMRRRLYKVTLVISITSLEERVVLEDDLAWGSEALLAVLCKLPLASRLLSIIGYLVGIAGCLFGLFAAAEVNLDSILSL